MRAESIQKRLVALATLALAGCVELDPQQLIVQEFEPVHRHAHSVTVTVEGPSDGDLWWNTNEVIQLALEETMREARVFSEVIGVEQGVADYQLKVDVAKILQWGTFTCEARAVLRWELFETGQSDPTWHDLIDTNCSSRVRQTAMECAVRNNLNEGIQRLSELELVPGGSSSLEDPRVQEKPTAIIMRIPGRSDGGRAAASTFPDVHRFPRFSR